MTYASYEDYSGSYHGTTLTAEQFDRYAARAGEYLELLSYGRCDGVSDKKTCEKLMLACCELAEELHRQQNEPEVLSQSVGKWSSSFAREQDRERRLADIVRLRLRGTGLLWRGWRYDGEQQKV